MLGVGRTNSEASFSRPVDEIYPNLFARDEQHECPLASAFFDTGHLQVSEFRSIIAGSGLELFSNCSNFSNNPPQKLWLGGSRSSTGLAVAFVALVAGLWSESGAVCRLAWLLFPEDSARE